MDPKIEGYQAFSAGLDHIDNPYPTGTPEYEAWAEGWDDADFEIDWEG